MHFLKFILSAIVVAVLPGIAPFTETDHYANGTSSSFSGYNFTGQATILGLRFGRALGGFVELGYGYKGIEDGGISYDPDYKKHHPFYR